MRPSPASAAIAAPTRRAFVSAIGAAGIAAASPPVARAQTFWSGAVDGAQAGLVPGSEEEQGVALGEALKRAENADLPLFLPPCRYRVATVDLPDRVHLIGIPGETRLVFAGGPYLLRAEGTRRLRIEGVALDGESLPLAEGIDALLDVYDVADLVLDDCQFIGSGASAATLRSVAGRVERSRFDGARTVGLELVEARGMIVRDNVATGCGDTGILVARYEEGADGTIVTGNRVTDIRAESGGTGQYGNGINLDKANGVVIANNRIDNCAFSAIRCFSSDALHIGGNVATRSGEMAVYVEFAFEGAIVANNVIDGGNGGISFANSFEHGGRLGTCSGNVVRNITGGPRYADGNPQIGAGISAEADIAVTGNVVEDAIWGISLGWGPHLRNVSAVGNVIRRADIGIAVSVVEGAGPALVADNLIAETRRGAILGARWEEPVTADLMDGAADFPQLTVSGNRSG
jgi:uncharacterized secreted repeat protein (TIGR03808 family)